MSIMSDDFSSPSSPNMSPWGKVFGATPLGFAASFFGGVMSSAPSPTSSHTKKMFSKSKIGIDVDEEIEPRKKRPRFFSDKSIHILSGPFTSRNVRPRDSNIPDPTCRCDGNSTSSWTPRGSRRKNKVWPWSGKSLRSSNMKRSGKVFPEEILTEKDRENINEIVDTAYAYLHHQHQKLSEEEMENVKSFIESIEAKDSSVLIGLCDISPTEPPPGKCVDWNNYEALLAQGQPISYQSTLAGEMNDNEMFAQQFFHSFPMEQLDRPLQARKPAGVFDIKLDVHSKGIFGHSCRDHPYQPDASNYYDPFSNSSSYTRPPSLSSSSAGSLSTQDVIETLEPESPPPALHHHRFYSPQDQRDIESLFKYEFEIEDSQ